MRYWKVISDGFVSDPLPTWTAACLYALEMGLTRDNVVPF